MTHDWIKIKTEYMTNRTMSLEDVANKHAVPSGYLRDVAAKEKWNDTRTEIWLKSGERVLQKLPDAIADVKLRHIRIAKVMQNKMIDRIKNDKIKSKSTYSDLKTAIDIERDALGLNDRKTDEQTQTLQQFNFLLNLKPDELRRFIRTVESKPEAASSSDGQDAPAKANES